MAIETLGISAAYTRNGETVYHDVLGLADPLGFAITATGVDLAGNYTIAVQFLSFAGAVIASGNFIITAASTGVTASGTGELGQRRPLNYTNLKTSFNAGGDSTLRATYTPPGLETLTADASIEVVLASAWGIKSRFFPGVPDQVIDKGFTPHRTIDLIRDSQIWREIEASCSRFERSTNIFLRKRIVATQAFDDQDYDIMVEAKTITTRVPNIFLRIPLPFFYIQDTPAFKFYYGTQEIFEVPDSWRLNTMDRREAVVKHVPAGAAGADSMSFTFAVNLGSSPMFPAQMGAMGGGGASIFGRAMGEGGHRLPNSCHFRYTAGWPETETQIPAHFVRYIERDCAMAIADLWWQGLTQGLGSKSLSADGLSRSTSRNDPGFTQAKEAWGRQQEKEMELINLDVPRRVAILGGTF